jgi:hypothetical protein
MARFLIYGSSATYGLHGGEQGGWADRLKQTIASRDLTREAPRGRVFNLAVGALCLPEIVEYLPADIARYRARCRMLGIFMVGNAESAAIGEHATEPNIPLRDFQDALETATAICEDQKVRTLFVGLSPIDHERPVHPHVRTSAELSQTYEEAIRTHAHASKSAYIDIQDHLKKNDIPETAYLADDGQHPNAFGHGIIHDLVLHEIDSMLAPNNR